MFRVNMISHILIKNLSPAAHDLEFIDMAKEEEEDDPKEEEEEEDPEEEMEEY